MANLGTVLAEINNEIDVVSEAIKRLSKGPKDTWTVHMEGRLTGLASAQGIIERAIKELKLEV